MLWSDPLSPFCSLSFSLALRLVDNKGERPLLRETAVGRKWRGIGPQGKRRAKTEGKEEKRDVGEKKKGYHLAYARLKTDACIPA